MCASIGIVLYNMRYRIGDRLREGPLAELPLGFRGWIVYSRLFLGFFFGGGERIGVHLLKDTLDMEWKQENDKHSSAVQVSHMLTSSGEEPWSVPPPLLHLSGAGTVHREPLRPTDFFHFAHVD